MAFDLSLFLQAGDPESARYRVLDGLQQVRRAFADTEVYPHLGSLIHLHGTLAQIVDRMAALRDADPGELDGIDPVTRSVVYARRQGEGELEPVEELIRWALPHLRAAIDEGRTIFEFVEGQLQLEPVGIVPSYDEEGYLLVPDAGSRSLHVLHYSLSLFTGAETRYRSLKTSYVRAVPSGSVLPAPRALKLELAAENASLPNPATFLVDSTIDLPYEPTVLPVAKRMLMRRLCTGEA